MSEKQPRLCFVGNMLGKNTGFVTTQGQILADLFIKEGYRVTCVSSKINRISRFAEIMWTVCRGRRQFDVVVVEVYSGLSFLIAEAVSLLCRFLTLPLILVLHGGNLPEFSARQPERVKRVLRRADMLVAPSEFLKSELDFLGFSIRVIPNVLEIEKYRFNERAKINPRLLWMRSFHEIYNPQMAIETLRELKKHFPFATLVMAGKDKGLQNDCRRLAETLEIAGAVNFAGFLDDEKKALEFSRADIYLNTNRIDNMPVSVLEAAACGLAVVATNVGGLPYLIKDGENGLLCESENPESMAEAVARLLADPALSAKISRSGRRLAEHSSWSRVKKEWEGIFEEIEAKRQSSESLNTFS